MAAPLAATAPPLSRRCAALAGAACPRLARTPAACLAGCGWNSLVRRLPDSLASAFVPTFAGRDSASHAGLCLPPAGPAAAGRPA